MRDYPAIELALDPIARRDDYERLLADLDADEPFGVEESWTSIRVYFSDAPARDRAAARVRAAWPDLECLAVEVSDEDWAARSQANLGAVAIDGFTIHPPWDLPEDPGAPHVVIQPSMGFGTGHHASTYLCVELLLSQPPLDGRSVLDVGTGSGVLAIIAVKRGASRVVAIDPDPDARQSARENLDLNAGTEHIDLRGAALGEAIAGGPFDLVLANLTGTMLSQGAADLSALTAAGGQLIVSGIEAHEAAEVMTSLTAAGLQIAERRDRDSWVALRCAQPR